MNHDDNQQLAFWGLVRIRFTLREVVCDLFLLSLCLALVRLLPREPDEVRFNLTVIIVSSVVFALAIGRICSARVAACAGAALGAMLALWHVLSAALATRRPDYPLLIAVAPVYALAGAAVLSFSFWALHVLQHWGRSGPS